MSTCNCKVAERRRLGARPSDCKGTHSHAGIRDRERKREEGPALPQKHKQQQQHNNKTVVCVCWRCNLLCAVCWKRKQKRNQPQPHSHHVHVAFWTQPPPQEGHSKTWAGSGTAPRCEHAHSCIAGDCTVSLVYWSQNQYLQLQDCGYRPINQ